MLSAVYFSMWSFILVFALIGMLCTRELMRMAPTGTGWFIWPTALASFTLILGTGLMGIEDFAGFSHNARFLMFAGFMFTGMLGELFSDQSFSSRHLGIGFVAFMYIGYSISCFVNLGFFGGGYDFILPMAVMIMVWTNDTIAYLTGKAIGRTKLFERISPNKTWEGTAGGFVATFLVAMAFAQYAPTRVGIVEWAIIGAFSSVFATLGDLVQSMFKREFGKKDSGNLLPGHGGVYDRFDGLILVGPAVYWALIIYYSLG